MMVPRSDPRCADYERFLKHLESLRTVPSLERLMPGCVRQTEHGLEGLVECSVYALFGDFLPMLGAPEERQLALHRLEAWHSRSISQLHTEARRLPSAITSAHVAAGSPGSPAFRDYTKPLQKSTESQLVVPQQLEERVIPDPLPKPANTSFLIKPPNTGAAKGETPAAKEAGKPARTAGPKTKKKDNEEDGHEEAMIRELDSARTHGERIHAQIRQGTEAVDAMGIKIEEGGNRLASDNTAARALLGSASMDWWITILLLMISLGIFYFMLLFILATKIINW